MEEEVFDDGTVFKERKLGQAGGVFVGEQC